MLELFKGDKVEIKENCQVEILANTVLPHAIGISDGVWAVAARSRLICLGYVGEDPLER